MKSTDRAKHAVLAINAIRMKDSSSLTTQDLIQKLRDFDCPFPQTIPKVLVELGVLERKKGVCTFISQNPVHFEAIKPHLDKISSTFVGYNQKNTPKKTGPTIDQISTELLIEELKKRGDYRIQLHIIQNL